MSITASKIVSFTPRVVAAGASDLETNGLFLTESDLIQADAMYATYYSADAVANAFGVASKEYELAQIYFSGYINKRKVPSALSFGRVIREDAPAWLRSGPLGGVDGLKVAGSLTISVDGIEKTVDVDLTSYTTQSDMAQALATAIGDVTVEYNAVMKKFIIKTTTVGADSRISVATGDVADVLGLSEDAGAIVSKGGVAASVAETMRQITGNFKNFVTFSTAYEASDEENIELAKWVSANYGYAFIAHTTEANALVPESTADLASKLKEETVQYVCAVWGGAPYAAFVMGCFASIAWDRNNAVITQAFKRSALLSPNVSSDDEFDCLNNKGYTFIGNFACRNSEFNVAYQGFMVYGDFKFLDTLVNDIWLNSKLQTSVFFGLQSLDAVPYNEQGYTSIRAWMLDAAEAAIKNGIIRAGITLNETQKDALYTMLGDDYSAELYQNGFVIVVKDPGALARQNRTSPETYLAYTSGGSVHAIHGEVAVVL